MQKKRLALIMVLMVLLTSFAMAEGTWTCKNCQQEVPAELGNYCPRCGMHNHEWCLATCTQPESCSCGETRGTALGHDWRAATDQEPETCRRCGETRGEALKDLAEGVMTHEQYVAAAVDDEVTIETYVQATQSWWDGKITVYGQSEDGAYFIYNMTCTEEDAAKLVPGTKIRVKGYKAEWAGEVEVAEGATFEILDGSFIAEAEDVTDKLGTEELINHMNEKAAFKGMTVEAYDESGAAFAYKNAENKTDDLYFKVSKDGQVYDFCVEFYLCGNETEVYKAVEALQVGDVIDIEAYLYWYNGANPHTIKVTKHSEEQFTETEEYNEGVSEGVMTHEQYVAAAMDDEVTIETYVQATQSWWDGKITVYGQSKDGAYFIYNMSCSEEDAAKLVPGTKIRVKGYKTEWAGEVEVAEGATFEILDGIFIAEAEDVTDKLGTDELINHMNEKVAFMGMTVEAYDETGAAFAYKNAENKTDDLYFKVSRDGQVYDFCVEFYLCGHDTEVYKAVEALQVGDVIDIEAYLYWYNGANPHTIKVTRAE